MPPIPIVPPIPISTPLSPTITLTTIWTATSLSTLGLVAAVVAISVVAAWASTAVALEAIIMVLVSPLASSCVVTPPVPVIPGLISRVAVGRLLCGSVAVDDEVINYGVRDELAA